VGYNDKQIRQKKRFLLCTSKRQMRPVDRLQRCHIPGIVFNHFSLRFFSLKKSVMFYFRIVLCFVYETFDFISQQLVKSTILYCKLPSGLTTKQRLVQLVDA